MGALAFAPAFKRMLNTFEPHWPENGRAAPQRAARLFAYIPPDTRTHPLKEEYRLASLELA